MRLDARCCTSAKRGAHEDRLLLLAAAAALLPLAACNNKRRGGRYAAAAIRWPTQLRTRRRSSCRPRSRRARRSAARTTAWSSSTSSRATSRRSSRTEKDGPADLLTAPSAGEPADRRGGWIDDRHDKRRSALPARARRAADLPQPDPACVRACRGRRSDPPALLLALAPVPPALIAHEPPRPRRSRASIPIWCCGAYAVGVFPMADARDAAGVYWVEPRAPRDPAARRLPPLALAAQARSLPIASASPPIRRSPRSSRSAPKPPPTGPTPGSTAAIEHVFLDLHRARLRAFGRMLGRRPAGRRALRPGARPRVLRRKHGQPRAPTRRRSRSPGWSRGCGSAASPCSTASSRPPTSPSLGAVEIARVRLSCALLGPRWASRSAGLLSGAARRSPAISARSTALAQRRRRRSRSVSGPARRERTSCSSWSRRRRPGAGRRSAPAAPCTASPRTTAATPVGAARTSSWTNAPVSWSCSHGAVRSHARRRTIDVADRAPPGPASASGRALRRCAC